MLALEAMNETQDIQLYINSQGESDCRFSSAISEVSLHHGAFDFAEHEWLTPPASVAVQVVPHTQPSPS